MPVQIDPDRREVVAGGRRFPFRLDCREDHATVAVDGCEYRVRPLRWREKVTLARFVAAGEDLVAEEFLRLCVVDGLPDGLPAAEREALGALARWVNEPPDGIGVPLDRRSLAAVTLQLCRAMHLRPADFDALPAVDVEAMWLALGSLPEEEREEEIAPRIPRPLPAIGLAGRETSSSMKIVVVPDPVPVSSNGSGATGVPPAGTFLTPPVVAADGPMTSAPADVSPLLSVEVPPSDSRDQDNLHDPSPVAGILTIPPVAPASDLATGPAGAPRTRPARPPLRFRLMSDARQARREEPRPAEERAAGAYGVTVSYAPPAAPLYPLAGAAALAPLALPLTDPAPALARSEVPPCLAPEPQPGPTLAPQAAVAAALDADAIFDELADRLERAAADMGIVES